MKKNQYFLLSAGIGWILLAQSLLSQSTLITTKKDQKSISLTIYNGGIGLVRESRSISFQKGLNTIHWDNISQSLLPQTVFLQSNETKGIRTSSVIYDTQILRQQSLIESFLGKDIFLATTNPKTGEEKTIPAKLLAYNDVPIFLIENQVHVGHPGRMVFPSLPQNLSQRPRLLWEVNSPTAQTSLTTLSYQTTGLSWSCDYNIQIQEKENQAELQSWVTLGNSTGISFENAELQLVAGKVSLLSNQPYHRDYPVRASIMSAEKSIPEPEFQQENLSDYYLYSLDTRVNLETNQTKQFSFFEANGIQIEKRYSFENLPIQTGESKFYQNADIQYSFLNTKSNNLGRPFPGGTIRIFKTDSRGKMQLLGEDRIDHTPENESVRVRVGKAFDVVAELRQTNYQKFKVTEGYIASYQVEVRNRKKEKVPVRVYIPVYGEWKVTDNNYKFEKESQYRIYFDLDIPGEKNILLKYSIENKL